MSVERFSTRLVSPGQRHAFWRDVVAQAFPGMTAFTADDIRADLSRWSVGQVRLARARSEQARVSRVANLHEGPNILLHLLRRGTVTMMHGKGSSTARAGGIVIADDRHDYSLEISAANDCLILQVPMSLLGAADGGRWHGSVLPAQDPHVAFLKHVLEGLWKYGDDFDDLDADAGALLADAAGMICRRMHRLPSSAEDAPNRSPIDYVMEQLAHPDMGTAMIGDALGLSPRAVQKMFLRSVGKTPTAFVTEKRLERACALLIDREQTITDIAFHVGFNDSAFFARCFRRQYGVTPSQWRMTAGSRPS